MSSSSKRKKSMVRPKDLNPNATSNGKRFKFMSFADRLRQVEVSVSFKTVDTDEPSTEVGSFFFQRLLDLRELDCTLAFVQFDRAVTPLSQSLPLLLFHREEIVNLLCAHLQIQDTPALSSLLSLVSTLARDLRHEFAPFFPRIFDVLVGIINPADVEALEGIFTCLSFLFKYLAKLLVADLPKTFSYYAPLISKSQKPYIRQFAAESFAFLFRKVKSENIGEAIELLLDYATEKGDVDGVSLLLFEAAKSIKGGFHSRMPLLIKTLLYILSKRITEANLLGKDLMSIRVDHAAVSVMDHLITMMCHWSKLPHNTSVWTVFFDELNDHEEEEIMHVAMVMRLIGLWILGRKGTRIVDHVQLCNAIFNPIHRVITCTDNDAKTLFAKRSAIDIISAIEVTFSPLSAAQERKKLLALLDQHADALTLLGFIENGAASNSFQTTLMPLLNSSLSKFWSASSRATLVALSRIVTDAHLTSLSLKGGEVATPRAVKRRAKSMISSVVSEMAIYDDFIKNMAATIQHLGNIPNELEKWADHPKQPAPEIALQTCVFLHLSCVITDRTDALTSLIVTAQTTLLSAIQGHQLKGIAKSVLESLLAQSIHTAIVTSPDQLPKLCVELLKHIASFNTSCIILPAAAAMLQAIDPSTITNNDIIDIEAIASSLMTSLTSYQSAVRLASLKILRWLFSLPSAPSSDIVKEAVGHAMAAEELETSLQSYRAKIMHLQLFQSYCATHALPSFLAPMTVSYLLGFLSIPFSHVWERTVELLTREATDRFQTFWSVFHPFFMLLRQRAETQSREEAQHTMQTVVQEILAEIHQTLLTATKPNDDDDEENEDENEEEEGQGHVARPTKKHRFNKGPTSTTSEWKRSGEYAQTDTNVVYQQGRLANSFAIITNPQHGMHLILMQLVEASEASERLDGLHFYTRMWNVFSHIPAVAERVSRHLVPIILEFVDKEYLGDNSANTRTTDRKGILTLLAAMLSLLGKWKNPKAAFRAAELRKMLLRLVAWADDKVQKLSLDALVQWRDKSLTEEHVAILHELLDEKSFRDQLARLIESPTGEGAWVGPLSRDGNKQDLLAQLDDSSVADDNMELIMSTKQKSKNPSSTQDSALLSLVLRVLFGKMMRRQKAERVQAARRATILSFVAALNDSLVAFFIHLLVEPFIASAEISVLDETTNHMAVLTQAGLGHVPLQSPSVRIQLGFSNVLADILKYLGVRVRPFLPVLLRILLWQCVPAQLEPIEDEKVEEEEEKEKEKEEEEEEGSSEAQQKQLRLLALRQLTSAFKSVPDFDWEPFLDELFNRLVIPRISKLSQEQVQTPTALMTLLTTWASSAATASLLVSRWTPNALPTLFVAMAMPSAGLAVIKMILDAVDNLLEMNDKDGFRSDWLADQNISLSDDVSLGLSLMTPHLPILLDGLGKLLTRLDAPFLHVTRSHKTSATDWTLIRRVLGLLARLSGFLQSPDLAARLIGLLLPSLQSIAAEPAKILATGGEVIWVPILEVVGDVAPLITIEGWKNLLEKSLANRWQDKSNVIAGLIQTVSPLFGCLQTLPARRALVRIFVRVSHLTNDVTQRLLGWLDQLNAVEANKVDHKPDWARRLEAYSALAKELQAVPAWVLPLALHALLFSLKDPEELAARNSAAHALRQFFARVGKERQQDEAIWQLLVRLVWVALRNGLRHRTEVVRADHLTLIGELVRQFPMDDPFSSLVPLLHIRGSIASLDKEDDEASFFVNLYHLQSHRRIRAIRRMREQIESGVFTSSTLMTRFFQPLVLHVLLESDKATQANLLDEAVLAMQAIANHLPWGAYHALVKQLLTMLPRKQNIEKILLRTLVAVLQAFHFDVGDGTNAAVTVETPTPAKEIEVQPEQATSIEQVNAEPEEEPEEEEQQEQIALPTAAATVTRTSPERILEIVTNSLLPDLRRYLLENERSSKAGEFATAEQLSFAKGDKLIGGGATSTVVAVRAPLALAVVHVLKGLPRKHMEAQLPWLITTMAGVLKSRNQEVRNTARPTIIAIAKELGPRYYAFIIKELETTLKRGYQRHILVYTLHALLSELIPHSTPGDWDSSAATIVAVLMEELVGKVGEEKEVEGVTVQTKEAKSRKANDTFELLATSLSFASLPLLLQPLIDHLIDVTDKPRDHALIQEVFRRISLGILSNNGISSSDLLLLIHGFISGSTPFLKLPTLNDQRSSSDGDMSVPKLHRVVAKATKDRKPPPSKAWAAFAPILVEFGLRLLSTAFKRSKLDFKDAEQQPLLAALPPLMLNCLFTRQDSVLVLTLRALSQILATPLRYTFHKGSKDKNLNNATFSRQLVERLMFLLSHSPSAASEVAQGCFKVLTVMLRAEKNRDVNEPSRALLNEAQLTSLIDILKPELESGGSAPTSTTFSLLRAIIGRKLMSGVVYDVMDVVGDVLIRSQQEQVRNSARPLLVAFLLDYPIGPKRLQGHVDFLVRQLVDYEYETGRMAALETLAALVQQFPEQTFQEQSLLLLLSFTASLTHDTSATCREGSAAVIKVLFQKMDSKHLDDSWTLLSRWWVGEATLQRSAVQVTSLMVEALGSSFSRFVPRAIEFIVPILENIQDKGPSEEENHDESKQPVGESLRWEVLYYTLMLLSKLLPQYDVIWTPDATLETLFEGVFGCLLYGHAWVRRCASRVLALFFAKTDPITLSPIQTNPSVLSPPVSKKSRRSLDGRASTVTCFLWGRPSKLIDIAQSLLEQLRSPYLEGDASEQLAKNLFFIARCLHAHPSLRIGSMPSKTEEEEEEDEEEADAKSKQYSSLEWLARRLSQRTRAEAAKATSTTQRSLVFRWIAGLATFLPVETTIELLPVLLPPLMVATEATQTEQVVNDLRLLAQEVLDLLEKTIGTTQFLKAYQSVRDGISNKRAERKRKRAFEAVVDPESTAKRRVQRNLAKRSNRQRKANEFAQNKTRLRIRKAQPS